eukprot:14948771-Heterocapsa_arctica.AAC.1
MSPGAHDERGPGLPDTHLERPAGVCLGAEQRWRLHNLQKCCLARPICGRRVHRLRVSGPGLLISAFV